MPLSVSTPSQTAWALEGLIAAGSQPQADPAVKRGIEFLIKRHRPGNGWDENYPTGAGFAGNLIYHNYRNLWPTTALLRAVSVMGSVNFSNPEEEPSLAIPDRMNLHRSAGPA